MSLDSPTPTVTATPPELQRRPWMLEPGQPLIGVHDPLQRVTLTNLLHEATGILDVVDLEPGVVPSHIVVSTPISPIPMVAAYPNEQGQLERITALDPEIAWLPFFWLPPRLAHQYGYTDADGTFKLETEAEWHYRVTTELVEAGFYNEADGTWVDVLRSFAGIDTTSEAGRARVAAWLAGGSDPEIDEVPARVEAMFNSTPSYQEDTAWSVVLTSEEAESLALVQQYGYAIVLSGYIGDVLQTEDATAQREQAQTVLFVAWMVLDGVPEQVPLEGGDTTPVGEYLRQLALAAEQEGADPVALLGALQTVVEMLVRAGDEQFGGEAEE